MPEEAAPTPASRSPQHSGARPHSGVFPCPTGCVEPGRHCSGSGRPAWVGQQFAAERASIEKEQAALAKERERLRSGKRTPPMRLASPSSRPNPALALFCHSGKESLIYPSPAVTVPHPAWAAERVELLRKLTGKESSLQNKDK